MSTLLDTHELDELAADLLAAPAKFRAAASPVIIATSHAIAETAAHNAPRSAYASKKHIADTIEATGVDGEPLAPGALESEIGPTAYWGRFVEGGTSEQPPHPYLGPAYDTHEPEFLEGIATAAVEAVIR